MVEIRTVVLELLRAGPAHNQLLSPLTPYIALCGSEGPATVHLPFEHRQLLNRLERLRYLSGSALISTSQRESEVLELGAAIAEILASIPALSAQLALARLSPDTLINLRLAMAGSELSLLPFELAMAPEGYPGHGRPLFLQADTPITLTREVRRGRPLAVNWNRPPRILFVTASPASVTPVPAQEHLNVIRRAMEPWVRWTPDPNARLEEVKKHITVITDASLETIRQACAEVEYTHVHILAHGVSYQQAGDPRYGLALCGEGDPMRLEEVDGERLAEALRATEVGGHARSAPSLVTLATCDSGNVGSVLTPGGSIAHDLHAFGIPWVIASQFPLTMAGSVTMSEVLYERLLKGDDPRWIIHELRQRLSGRSQNDHDWASLVVYATIPFNFAEHVEAFRDRQTRDRLNEQFAKAQAMLDARRSPQEIDSIFEAVRRELTRWRETAPAGDGQRERMERAERWGMTAASEKRIAGIHMLRNDRTRAMAAWRESRDWYRKAMELEPANHWVLTQYLSLCAILDEPADHAWWIVARQLAKSQLQRDSTADRAWAFGTLAELDLLGTVYSKDEDADSVSIQERVVEACSQIRNLTGSDSFHVSSTRRQFQRYLEWWDRSEWREVARAAITALRS